ncbi:MAG: hypothetical protein QCI82_02415, partial [Candidatus Thermoplasmatota archaeon]|nr:hypothetical protein [Candidatus Thermoplasmatota archaeon]
MKKIIAALIGALTLMVIMTAAQDSGEGAYIENFFDRNGPTSDHVTLRGEGQTVYDSHLYFEIDRNVPIASASLKVSTVGTETGPWITNPVLDV